MIPILYEDRDLVICEKPIGLLSEAAARDRRSLPALLQRQTRAYRIDVIHRLDQPVGGAILYSKNSRATPGLYRQVAGHTVIKEYLAIVRGVPTPAAGEMHDFLLKDAARCKSRVVPAGTPGAKDAALAYRVLATRRENGVPLSLVKIRLHTGRTHQIRVQFSSRRCPLLGDDKYGAAAEDFRGLALWSYRLALRHPVTRAPIDVTCPPPAGDPWSRFDAALFDTPLD